MTTQRIRRGLLIAAATVLAALAGAAHARAAEPGAELHRQLQQLLRTDHWPGALVSVRSRGGRVRDVTAGVGDRRTRAPVPVDGEVRIGSNTKTFTATVLLQLVGEGRVELDAPVERYLPGLLRGDGIDGARTSVREVLQQTTGLPNYTNFLADGLLLHLHEYREPRGLLDLALRDTASFAPGARFEYSNTNYVVAGLIVEAVTQRPIAEEITRRIIRPLHLRHTYFPGVGEQRLRGRHPHGYHHDDLRKPLVDVTRQDPSFGWAAGQMVSTPSQLNRFFLALLRGRLLAPRQLREMQQTVPADDLGAGLRYGLGLIRVPLSCGGVAWGHGGDIPGYSTVNAATADGRAATLATTELPREQAQLDRLNRIVDRALCAG